MTNSGIDYSPKSKTNISWEELVWDGYLNNNKQLR